MKSTIESKSTPNKIRKRPKMNDDIYHQNTNPTNNNKETNDNETDIMEEMKYLKQRDTRPMPCYTYLPPEIGRRVLVDCDKIDQYGLFGSFPDWSGSTCQCTAYLPHNNILPSQTKGQRYIQAEFLKRAKKMISKGKPLRFVAEVESIDTNSSKCTNELTETGEQITDNHMITVTRRGIFKDEEKFVMEASKTTQACATLLVDKAAHSSGIPRNLARRWCLYDPYHRALYKPKAKIRAPLDCNDNSINDGNTLLNGNGNIDTTADDDTDDYVEDRCEGSEVQASEHCPELAASTLLVKVLGAIPSGKEVQAMEHLQMSEKREDRLLCNVDEDQDKDTVSFLSHLVALCRKERRRQSQKVSTSTIIELGGHRCLQSFAKQHLQEPGVCDLSRIGGVHAIINTINQSSNQSLPVEGCTPVKITAEGGGKFKLATTCCKEDEDVVQQHLNGIVSTIQSTYLSQLGSTILPVSRSATKKTLSTSTNDSTYQPTLNIGCIGDVSHGKSTLIRTITGKRTQSHSAEQQKHGMTIRLGFANASILKCINETCGKYCFRQDEVKGTIEAEPSCLYCGSIGATVVTRVSFIDCPGHSELMSTMMSGLSSFDAVIMAAAANQPCPTPQAKQHLHALNVSDRDWNGRIAVAQTKSELIVRECDTTMGELNAEEKLSLHAKNARRQLQSTAAADAPFFPICAPLGVGLESLAAWLAGVAAKDRPQQPETPIFHTLRSFDVNFAGTTAASISGGVLGGSIVGNGSFEKGETLEVRPGLCVGRSNQAFQTHPLNIQVDDLMSGKTSLHKATSGGLIALKSNLDPSLCSDDHLIGAVVGRVGTLPPVWGPTLYLTHVKLFDIASSKNPLKKDTKIRIHCGSATVSASVVRISTKRQMLEVKLDSPICASKGSMIGIEAKYSSRSDHGGFSLVASGQLADGSICCDGFDDANRITVERVQNETMHEDINDDNSTEQHSTMTDDTWTRSLFLQELKMKQGGDGTSAERISIPRPMVIADGGAHVRIANFVAIAKSLNREPGHLQKYIEKEANLSCTRAGESNHALRIRMKNRGVSELFSRILCRYVKVYVSCQQCKGARTEFMDGTAKKGCTEILCRNCNAFRFAPKI